MSGRPKKSASRADIEATADLLAKNSRLDDPLPLDTDFSVEEVKRIQAQISMISPNPSTDDAPAYYAFSAKHVATLVDRLRAMNYTTQPKAVSIYVHILSLMPEPKENAYLRRLLRSPHASGLPTLVAAHLLQQHDDHRGDGVTWATAGGPGNVCTMLINLLFWCDTTMGDDQRASIDSAQRTRLADILAKSKSANSEAKGRITPDQIEIERLAGAMNALEHMPGPPGYYLISTREYLEGQLPQPDSCEVCMGEVESMQVCSQCRSVWYCSKECQMKGWKAGHKIRCWKMLDGGENDAL